MREYSSLGWYQISGRGTVAVTTADREETIQSLKDAVLGKHVLIDGKEYVCTGVEYFCIKTVHIGWKLGLAVRDV